MKTVDSMDKSQLPENPQEQVTVDLAMLSEENQGNAETPEFKTHIEEIGNLSETLAEPLGEVYQSLRSSSEEWINQIPQEFAEMLGRVNNETVKLQDLSGEIDISYLRENDTNYFFKSIAYRKMGPPLYFLITVTKKKYNEHEVVPYLNDEINVLQRLDGKGVARFGMYFISRDGRIWTNQAFYQGKTLQEHIDHWGSRFGGTFNKRYVEKVVNSLMQIAQAMDGRVPRSFDPSHFVYDEETDNLVMENLGATQWLSLWGKDSNPADLALFFSTLLDLYGGHTTPDNVYILDQFAQSKYFKNEDIFKGYVKNVIDRIRVERESIAPYTGMQISIDNTSVSEFVKGFLQREKLYRPQAIKVNMNVIDDRINFILQSLKLYYDAIPLRVRSKPKIEHFPTESFFPFEETNPDIFKNPRMPEIDRIMRIVIDEHNQALADLNRQSESASSIQESLRGAYDIKEMEQKLLPVIDKDVQRTVELLSISKIRLKEFLTYIAKFTTAPSYYLDGLYVELALDIAKNRPKNGTKNSMPVAAVVVNRKTHEIIIGEKPQFTEQNTGIYVEEHAEMNALRKAVRYRWDMSDVDLYVSIESCLNCALGIAANFRPHRIMAAALDDNPYVNGNGIQLLAHERMNSSITFLPSTRKKGEYFIKIFRKSFDKRYHDLFHKKYVWILQQVRYSNVSDLWNAITGILTKSLHSDTRKLLSLTILVREFLIAAAVFPPLETQIVALDVRMDFRETQIEIVQGLARVNPNNDHFKVVLAGLDRNAIQRRYIDLKNSGIIPAERIYFLDNERPVEERLVNCQQEWGRDAAMVGKEYGGIDLTPAIMNLKTQNSGGVIRFRLDPNVLKQLQNATGFVPMIINIQPLPDLTMFLGLNLKQAGKAGILQ